MLDTERVRRMNNFKQRINDLYDEAELLRDICTEEEKKLFNDTRKALFDLRYPASRLAAKWEQQLNR